MRILALGDIVGTAAAEYVGARLWGIRNREHIDFVVANGENVTDIHGISANDAKMLLGMGIDLVTLGNHAFGRRDVYGLLDEERAIIRPANFSAVAPGNGYTVLRVGGVRLLCINVQGRVYLDPIDSPFETVDRILERTRGDYDLALMDIHAEATSEKLAIANYFDGRIHVMFGTHTHVQTADEQVLPKGSGYITDLGMSGPCDGVIGADAETVIQRCRTKIGTRLTVASGRIEAQGALFDLDTSSGRVKSVTRVKF
jgi:metallophosphoesterase (TIGR00282 family)